MKKSAVQRILIILLTGSVLVFLSCKKKKDSPNEEEPVAFDKQAMLINYADNVIVPSYTKFKISFDSLIVEYNTFKISATADGLQKVKQKLNIAYRSYQKVSLFGFGPGEDMNIRGNFNIFPTSVSGIHTNISSGDYNLGTISNLGKKGFPALDYLFYGAGSDSAQLHVFVSEPGRLKYVTDVLQDMSDRLNPVVSGWNNYRGVFINSLGTDVGSSIGFLINQLNYELDYLKNSKIGIPLGLKSGGTVLPNNSEAYFGGQSLDYIKETLNSIEDIYLGRSTSGVDGKGFDDYLEHLGVQYIDKTLNDAIKTQFQTARSKVDLIGDPFSQEVVSNGTVVKNAYNELVKLLVLLKTDMPSNLGVVITYQDGDGD
jgi:uncharacterized protein